MLSVVGYPGRRDTVLLKLTLLANDRWRVWCSRQSVVLTRLTATAVLTTAVLSRYATELNSINVLC